MKRLLLCLLALMLPLTAFAVTDELANINVVVTPASYGGCADGAVFEAGTCADLVSSPVGGFAFVWIVLSNEGGFPNGVGGARFGVEYDLVGAVIPWALCTGGSEISEDGWPASGTGNAVTWSGGCYDPPSQVAVIGYLTADDGASGFCNVIGDPRVGFAQYSDCLPTEFELCPENLGGCDLAVGCTPVCGDHCEVTPVEEMSWGKIKSLY